MTRFEDFSDEQIASLAESLKPLVTGEWVPESLTPEEQALEDAARKLDRLTEGLNTLVARLVERLHAAPLDCATATTACTARIREARALATTHPGLAEYLDLPAIRRAEALVAFSNRITRQRLASLRSRAATITPESDLDGALALLALGQRGTPQFWSLARQVRDRMDEVGEMGVRRSLLYALIPRRALYAKEEAKPSLGRAAERASTVEWVRPSGAPGLGKRA